jgi:hypothetical protein
MQPHVPGFGLPGECLKRRFAELAGGACRLRTSGSSFLAEKVAARGERAERKHTRGHEIVASVRRPTS